MQLKTLSLILLLSLHLFAKAFVAPHFGMSWPGTLNEIPEKTDHHLYDVGVDWGGLGSSSVGFMGRFNIMTKGTNEYTTISNNSSDKGGDFETVQEINSIKRRLFSIGCGIIVAPMRDRMLHPTFKLSYEPSLMVLINDDDDNGIFEEAEVIPPSGLYRGAMKRLEVELHKTLDQGNSVFIGVGYQFGYMKKRINYTFFEENREYVRQSMDGLSVRIGFLFG